MANNEKLIIANCSGFFGDRLSAAREMVEGGPIDVLTGDYLAELTMAILYKQKVRDPNRGYAHTFLKQVEEVMGQCLDKGIRIVSNAGGLNPKSLAADLEKSAQSLGLHPKIAYVEGDDLIPRISELQAEGETFTHLDKGITLASANVEPMTANAYFGGWGIAKALEEGADIVVTGRVADACVVMGPAAWHFGWKKNDWDRLAGAAIAGHIIECSGQACGGNYSLFEEVPSYHNVGFPIAEMREDGSFIITKHPGTGGLVSVGTVTAQLLYETRTPEYLTPDVGARFETINISQAGPDRVEIKGVCGQPPPATTKVCINNPGGYRSTITRLIAGLNIEAKAKILEETAFAAVGGKDQFEKVRVELIRSDKENPPSNEEAYAYFRISVMDPDPKKVGMLSRKITEHGLCSVPGVVGTAPPSRGEEVIQHWPALVSMSKMEHRVVMGDDVFIIEPAAEAGQTLPASDPHIIDIPDAPDGPTVTAHLGDVFAARSGDKGGNANVGIWGKTPESYAFLQEFLTIEKFKEIMKDMAEFEIERYELPNLFALNFYVKGVLGEGVSASMRMDGQAKSLGEYLRSKLVEIPASLIN